MEDFLTFEMKAMSVKAKENPDMRWTVEIEDDTGAKVTVPWIQLSYMVEQLAKYIHRPL